MIIGNTFRTGPYVNADIIEQYLESGTFDFSIYDISDADRLIDTVMPP